MYISFLPRESLRRSNYVYDFEFDAAGYFQTLLIVLVHQSPNVSKIVIYCREVLTKQKRSSPENPRYFTAIILVFAHQMVTRN
jgi:hypothetical protein